MRALYKNVYSVFWRVTNSCTRHVFLSTSTTTNYNTQRKVETGFKPICCTLFRVRAYFFHPNLLYGMYVVCTNVKQGCLGVRSFC